MRRREFIGLVGGAAAWPVAARAQQQGRIRRIGVLFAGPNDATFQSKFSAFQQALQKLGWIEGSNTEFQIRWGDNVPDRTSAEARELVRGRPDVVLVAPSHAVILLRKEANDIPMVFLETSDPVGQGIVKSLARPGGNITGFSRLEFSVLGKWVQTLKEVAPSVTRVALMIHRVNAVSDEWYKNFNALAPSLKIEPISARINERTDIENVIKILARKPVGGLICPGDTFVDSPTIRSSIISLTAAHRVPALSAQREFVTHGGLMSYGIDGIDQYRLAASYVDRILKGESPADLPVQAPTKFQLVINLKTAKALGLTVPPTLLARADEVIE